MDKLSLKEYDRTVALCALGVLDTPPEARFDQFTTIARAAFGVPIALISLVDAKRQWFKSRCGLDAPETPRSMAFCSHAIEGTDTMVVPDALLDPRFADNPLVLGAPHIRFYAGHPVRARSGHAVGTLCIIDTAPRELNEQQLDMLRSLAGMVEAELNRDSLERVRQFAEGALHELNAALETRVRERTVALEEKNEALSREVRQRADVEANLRRSEARVRAIIEASFSAFIATDEHASIIEWNKSAERVFGWSRDEVLGLPWTHVIDSSAGAFPSGSAADQRIIRLPAHTRDGAAITVEMVADTYVIDGQMYFGAFINDVSEQSAIARALEQKQELLDAVLETVDVGVVACDGTGNLSFFNRAAREFHGQQASRSGAHEWASQYDMYHADGKTALSPNDIPLLRALAGETVKDVPMVIAPRGMRRRLVLVSGRVLSGADGERLGAVVAMQDITALNASQEKLRHSEKMLRSITENLPALIGQVDRQGRFAFLNARALEFYRLSAARLLGQSVRTAYSAADYAKIEGHIQTALAGRRVSFESDIVIEGRSYYFHADYVPQFDEQGKPDGFFAMAFDITARRLSEIAQHDSEERLRTITDNVPVLISYVDSELRYRFANAMYKDWLGMAAADMLGRTVTDVFGDDYYAARAPSIAQAMGGHMSSVEVNVRRKGYERILNTTYMPHYRDGKVAGVYVLATDATAARSHEKKLLALANADPLTNLPNRRMYEFHLVKALALAKRQQTRLALMYLDLDDFKRINDSHGHAVGDAVLVEFGKRVGATLRESDLLARLAGDEFTVVLEAVDNLANCELVARKICEALRAPFQIGPLQLRIGASIGVALADGTVDQNALSAKADEALYAAKRAGKGRFAVLEINPATAADNVFGDWG